MTYSAERLWAEVVYVAYHLHWPCAEILDLDHGTRAVVIAQIAQLSRA